MERIQLSRQATAARKVLLSDPSWFAAALASDEPVVLFGTGLGCVQADFVIEEATKN
jgi:hypothetical protein